MERETWPHYDYPEATCGYRFYLLYEGVGYIGPDRTYKTETEVLEAAEQMLQDTPQAKHAAVRRIVTHMIVTR